MLAADANRPSVKFLQPGLPYKATSKPFAWLPLLILPLFLFGCVGIGSFLLKGHGTPAVLLNPLVPHLRPNVDSVRHGDRRLGDHPL